MKAIPVDRTKLVYVNVTCSGSNYRKLVHRDSNTEVTPEQFGGSLHTDKDCQCCMCCPTPID
jgi:hypothetical protein